jgi:putative ABC transport system permease protein
MTFPSETPRWRRYLRFWRRDYQADIDDELAFHFQTRIGELTDRGLSPADARARALAEFGDVSAFRSDLQAIDSRMERRARRTEWLDGWRQDLVYSVRSLRRTPGVTAAIVLTLALGLGANAAMFTLLNAVFLKPPGGVARPHQVRRVWTDTQFSSGREFWSGYDYQQYEAINRAIAGIGTSTIYSHPRDAKVRRGATQATAVKVYAAASFFTELGVKPAIGRFFSHAEDQLGAGQHVVVASHDYWRRSLDADSAVLGETIRIDGVPHTLIGVADAAFNGTDLTATDLWVPLATTTGYRGKSWWTDPNVNGMQVLIRVSAGVTDDLLDRRLTDGLRAAAPEESRAKPGEVTRVGSIITARGPGKRVQEVEIATRLGGVALVVLIIACANVVSLLLARAVRRRREIGMRLALGISRGRLARLILTESVLLATLAGIGAVLAAFWGGLALRALLLPDIHWVESPLDWRVLAGAIVTSIAAGLAAGILPVVQSGSIELTSVLKAVAREGFVRRSTLRSALVVAQVALSVMLLVGAALFVRSLSMVRQLDLGFDASRLIYASVEFETRDPARDSLTPARLTEVAERLRSAPGVSAGALTSMRPLSGFSIRSYYPDADTLARKKPWGVYWAVSRDYFAAADLRIVSGATFPNATGTAMPPSVIVNTAMADALWPGESPLGRCVRFIDPNERCNSIVGVVETARWRAVIEDATPQFYLPLGNMPFPDRAGTIALRAEAAMAPAVIREARRALTAAFPDGEPVIKRMSDALEPQYRPWRLGATLFSLFGLLAGVVAALGVYSTVAYNVSQRTHEFGVRVAVGAQVSDIVGHVLGDGLRTVAIGIVIGVGLSLAAGKVVAALLYGVSPRDPGALSVVAVALLAVAVVAALVPAWRASRVDPLTALRAE